MFESLGPAVPGSLVMEDREADFLPYLSQDQLPEGHPELGAELGCRRCWVSSRSPAPANRARPCWPEETGESQVLCPVLHH